MKFLTFLTYAVLPATVFGHMGFWDESCYGCSDSDGYEPVTPLANMPFSKWWFHGHLNKPPKAGTKPFELPAGGKAVAELSCRRQFTSMETNSPGNDPCPIDVESMHAGNPLKDSQLLGCGLAIAYKSDAKDVKPEDFTIFTVNTQCVKTLRTEFEVPAGMPECPNGKCICAWFWQGQDSADEMYMTGFDCTVTGGSKTAQLATPKAARYCPGNPDNCLKGAKQPLYWANDRNTLVGFKGTYENKPAYNANWGFQNGAQNDIFAVKDTTPVPAPNPIKAPVQAPAPTPTPAPTSAPAEPSSSSSAPVETTFATRTRTSSSSSSSSTSISTPTKQPAFTPLPRPGSGNGPATVVIKQTETVYKTIYSTVTGAGAAKPTAESCAWKGHCEGASCVNHQDCDGDLACNSEKKCAPPSTLRSAKFRGRK